MPHRSPNFYLASLPCWHDSGIVLRQVVDQVESVTGRVLRIESYATDIIVFRIMIPARHVASLGCKLRDAQMLEEIRQPVPPAATGPGSGTCIPASVTLRLTAA